MTIRDILDQCARSCVVLSRNGGRLRAEALCPDLYPLSPELAVQLREHKDEVLSYVDFEEQADRLLIDSTRRIAREWPDGCEALEHDEDWEKLEARLHDAYWSTDPNELEAVIRERECYALAALAAYKNHERRTNAKTEQP